MPPAEAPWIEDPDDDQDPRTKEEPNRPLRLTGTLPQSGYLGTAAASGGLSGILERMEPGITGARALALAGLIAALATAVLLWSARPRPEPVATARSTPVLTTPTQAAPTPTPSVIVHVTGKVRRPGIVALPSGSRVADAIEASGGLRPGATPGTLNLARKLQDGEQIAVGVPAPPPPPGSTTPTTTESTPIDLNTATLDQLQLLPGVGPVLAQRILDHRTQHGPFRDITQLRQVTGIGDRRFADLRPHVRV